MKLHHLVLTLPVATLMALAGNTATKAAPPSASFSFGITSPSYDPGYDEPDDEDCLTEWEVVRELRHDGYRNLRLVDDDGDTLVFIARSRSRTYQLEVDACSGDVLSRARVRGR